MIIEIGAIDVVVRNLDESVISMVDKVMNNLKIHDGYSQVIISWNNDHKYWAVRVTMDSGTTTKINIRIEHD